MNEIALHFDDIIYFTLIQIIGLVMPGADLIIVVRNSIIYSRKAGIFTALGIAIAVLVHISYIIIGIDYISSHSGRGMLILKFLSVAYLIYIGCLNLFSSAANLNNSTYIKNISNIKAFFTGFLTNIFNIGAVFYFISMFSLLMDTSTPQIILFIYTAIISVTSMIWYSTAALFFSSSTIKNYFIKYQKYVERISGICLIVFALHILFTDL